MGKRGQRPAERTLVCVIQALMGLELLVELRNDLSIRGILDDCDNAMKYTHTAPPRFSVNFVLVGLIFIFANVALSLYVHSGGAW
jgi:hypothetical protein